MRADLIEAIALAVSKEYGGGYPSAAHVVRGAIAALSVAAEPEPVARMTHCHVKSGHLVRVLGIGKMQAEKWKTPTIRPDEEGRNQWTHVSIDMREVVIYEHDGNLWARPREEFEDGRFAALTPIEGV